MKREQKFNNANEDSKKKRILCCTVIEENGLFGLIDSKGEQVQQCRYLNIHQFSDNQDYDVIVLEDNTFRYDIAGDFKDGYAVVGFISSQDGFTQSLGVIDRHDRMVIPFKFAYIDKFAVIEGRVFAQGRIGWEMGKPYSIVCEDGNNYEIEEGDLSWPNELCIFGKKIVKKH